MSTTSTAKKIGPVLATFVVANNMIGSGFFLLPASLAGVPAMSVPAGLASAPDDPDGALPVGVQLMAPLLRDDLMYRVAWAVEQDAGFSPVPTGEHAVEVG